MRPAGPAPMTAMRSPLGGEPSANSRSRPAAPLTTQPMPAPPRISSTQVLQARQRRIGSPRRSFSTHCGSAIRLRPSATKSTLPLATAAVAVAGSPSRPTAITGTRTACFTSAAKSRNGASGIVIGGIITCAFGSER